MSYSYDDHNIFAKILRGEIPNKTVLETEYALAFEDIAPQVLWRDIFKCQRVFSF